MDRWVGRQTDRCLDRQTDRQTDPPSQGSSTATAPPPAPAPRDGPALAAHQRGVPDSSTGWPCHCPLPVPVTTAVCRLEGGTPGPAAVVVLLRGCQAIAKASAEAEAGPNANGDWERSLPSPEESSGRSAQRSPAAAVGSGRAPHISLGLKAPTRPQPRGCSQTYGTGSAEQGLRCSRSVLQTGMWPSPGPGRAQ